VTTLGGGRKNVYGVTRDEVARKLTKVLADLQQGIHPSNDRETVGSWLRQYVADLETRHASCETLKRYRGIFENHLKPGLGKIKLSQLQPRDVQAYQADLLKQGVPAKTISELMSHASIEVTANIYLHSLDVQVGDTAQSVARALAAGAQHGDRCPTCAQPLPGHE
jgi:hypothetical protein